MRFRNTRPAWGLAVVAAALAAAGIATGTQVKAASPPETVYLFNSQGQPVLQPSDYYQEGSVFDVSGTKIGSVPNPTAGWIVSGGTTIGVIDPSTGATEEGL